MECGPVGRKIADNLCGTVRPGTFAEDITNAVPGDLEMKSGAINHKCAESALSREKVGATSPDSVAAHFGSLEIRQAINAQTL